MVISALGAFDRRIEDHLGAIFGQLDEQPERFGIGEAGTALKQGQWYPPNAFHTYWTLEILDHIRRRFNTEYGRLRRRPNLDIERRRNGMLVWARQQLGQQIGLHSPSPLSSVLDTDQLAWSLTIFLRFDEELALNLETRDFVKQALKCLFSTQTDGTWRHYKPLFHYKKAGNAYCYVFETFAALLHCALGDQARAEMIRDLLRPYALNLMDLWKYADSTKIPHGSRAIGWCSGHRTNITEPESWATASVFSYAQALRRLIGIWCREEAARNFKTPRNRLTPENAEREMLSRGQTWSVNGASVAERLWTMFINPVRMHECADKLEPDSQPIEKRQARSAILFGPPGTSKTTLVRRLADVIGWNYVEIHASHFVAEGLAEVQKTADRIFKQLLELDHTVVLFDEIDELVRERDMEKDAFGRFLTTSMLPKLAELWEARKILYFVATNHINYFDSAIIRSHRFDALMLVSPPSFDTKIDRASKLLSKTYGLRRVRFQIQRRQIEKELDQIATEFESLRDTDSTTYETRVRLWREKELCSHLALAKFALLRFDEIDELAYWLSEVLKANSGSRRTITPDVLRKALTKVADSEWRRNKSYIDDVRDGKSERRDYQMLSVWKLAGRTGLANKVVEVNGARWLAEPVESLKNMNLPGFRLLPRPRGRVEIRPSKST
jgi:hypothetical protein